MAMPASINLNTKFNIPNTEAQIPQLGFGVYKSPQEVCKASTLTALKAGYRHIDTAQFYRNEKEVGQAVAESGIPREEIFITTKILAANGTPEDTYRKCLNSVELIHPGGYVDLFLIHSPSSGASKIQQMWQALEHLLKEGKVKAIGVSNFGEGHIEDMKQYATVWPPPVNQIELHPWCQQGPIVDYCNRQGILIEAYSPLTRMKYTHNERLVKIAKSKGKEPAHVLVRWCLQKGYIPLPKSDNPDRIKSNADVYDFELSDTEMKDLDEMDPGRESRGALVWKVVYGHNEK